MDISPTVFEILSAFSNENSLFFHPTASPVLDAPYTEERLAIST